MRFSPDNIYHIYNQGNNKQKIFSTGGTMHPMYRKVKQGDIENLRLHKLTFENGKAILGTFTNVYHWDHAEFAPEDFIKPPVFG